MLRVEEREEAVEEEVVRDRGCSIVLPDTGSLHHVAFLDFWLGSGGLVVALSLLATGSGELGLEVVLDLLLGRLLLLLERSEVALSTFLFLAFLLLGRLLLLLWSCQPSAHPRFACLMGTHLLCEVSEHVGDFLNLLVLACNSASQRMSCSQSRSSLTSASGVALGRIFCAVHLFRLGNVAVAVDNCGALGECDGLAGFALGQVGLCGC